MEEDLYSGSAIAARYGVSRAAVSNWLRRDIMPERCKPARVRTGGNRNWPMWRESQLPALDEWYAEFRERKGKPVVTPEMQEGIDMVTGACGGQVFFSRDFPQALILADDSTWIARVSSDGSTEEAYLSTEPIANYVDSQAYREEDLPELQGFTTGFTC